MNNEDRQKEYDAKLQGPIKIAKPIEDGLLPEARAYIQAHNEGLQKAIDYCDLNSKDEEWMASARLAFITARKELSNLLIKPLDTD